MAETVSKARLKKALATSIDHANQVVSSMKALDKDTLYAGVNEINMIIEEDPTMEKVFGDDLKTLRNNLRFISSASGIIKNASNAEKAADELVAGAERFMQTEK